MDIIYIYPFLECLNTKPIIKNKRLNNGVIFVLYCIISVMSTGDCFTPYYKSTFKNLDINNIHVFTWFPCRRRIIRGTDMMKIQRHTVLMISYIFSLCSNQVSAVFFHEDPRVFLLDDIAGACWVFLGLQLTSISFEH